MSVYEIQESIQKIIDDEISQATQKIKDRCNNLLSIIISNRKIDEMRKSFSSQLGNVNITLENNQTKGIRHFFDNANNENIVEISEDENEVANEYNELTDGISDEYDGDSKEENDDDDDEEIPVFEINIRDTDYFVSAEEPNFIFEKRLDETVGDCVGLYTNNKSYFQTYYKGEKCYYCVEENQHYTYISDTEIGDIFH